MQAVFAFAAFRGVKRDHVIAHFKRGDTGTNFDNHTCALVAQNGRKRAFRVGTRQGEIVGVAQAGCLDFHQNLALLRAVQVHFHDFHRFARFQGDGGSGAHLAFLPTEFARHWAKSMYISTRH